MHRTTKRAAKITALAAVAFIASATVANAATVNPDGTGFVGKGEVQSAYGMNNSKLQTAVDNNSAKPFTFSSVQPASQSLTMDVSQDATQVATQTVHRDLSCTVTTGGEKNPKVFHNDGFRNGVREGSRTGSRDGSRVGTLTGTLAAQIASDPRKTGQWTGWNLRGFASGPDFTPTGTAEFGDADFGDADFAYGGYNFGDVEWSGWVADGGGHPSDCDRNDSANDGKEITDLVDETTHGYVIPGDVTPGDVEDGEIHEKGIAPTGPAQVSVTWGGVTKALPITAPVA
jgi:hypothetical protein